MAWIPIRYRDFYDVPRAFVIEYGGTVFFFDGGFDERLDEYPDRYRVYKLNPDRSGDLEHSSWEGLESSGVLVGEVPVSQIRFDDTLREAVDDSVFERLLKGSP
jgi:hypothetical protein